MGFFTAGRGVGIFLPKLPTLVSGSSTHLSVEAYELKGSHRVCRNFLRPLRGDQSFTSSAPNLRKVGQSIHQMSRGYYVTLKGRGILLTLFMHGGRFYGHKC